LTNRGEKVVLGARRVERLQELVDEIKSEGGEAIYAITDVTKSNDVEALAKLALDTFGRIDVWLKNAGLMPHSTFDKLHLEEWERMVDVNIKGILYVIAVCLPVMCNKKRTKDDLYEH
jgi:NADP-dependent 3-hydroxy acid dehydrogenase YdfG